MNKIIYISLLIIHLLYSSSSSSFITKSLQLRSPNNNYKNSSKIYKINYA